MDIEEHKERHRMLHKYFDELLADWITHTGKRPSGATVLELMEWSAEQKENPEVKEGWDKNAGQKEKP